MLEHAGTAGRNLTVVSDGNDSTCFHIPPGKNGTLGSVRLFLNRSIHVALSRIVAIPRPNVVYYLLVNKNHTARRPELDIWKGTMQEHVTLFFFAPGGFGSHTNIHFQATSGTIGGSFQQRFMLWTYIA